MSGSFSMDPKDLLPLLKACTSTQEWTALLESHGYSVDLALALEGFHPSPEQAAVMPERYQLARNYMTKEKWFVPEEMSAENLYHVMLPFLPKAFLVPDSWIFQELPKQNFLSNEALKAKYKLLRETDAPEPGDELFAFAQGLSLEEFWQLAGIKALDMTDVDHLPFLKVRLEQIQGLEGLPQGPHRDERKHAALMAEAQVKKDATLSAIKPSIETGTSAEMQALAASFSADVEPENMPPNGGTAAAAQIQALP